MDFIVFTLVVVCVAIALYVVNRAAKRRTKFMQELLEIERLLIEYKKSKRK